MEKGTRFSSTPDFLEILIIRQDGRPELAGNAGSSWFWTMHVLHSLSAKYGIGLENGYADYQAVCTRVDDMSERDRWVLGSTFKGALVPGPLLRQYRDYLADFALEFPSPTLGRIIAVLDSVESPETVLGIRLAEASCMERVRQAASSSVAVSSGHHHWIDPEPTRPRAA